MIKRKFLAYGAVAILAASAGVYFGVKGVKTPLPKNPAVTNMFAQAMQDTQGKPQYLSQYKGKALIVNFWAPWCPPCVVEMPELSTLQAEIRSKDIQIIGIGIDTGTNIVEYATKHKIDYPLFAAGTSGTELARQFGDREGGLPFTVLIGRDGQVRKTYLGGIPFDKLRADLGTL